MVLGCIIDRGLGRTKGVWCSVAILTGDWVGRKGCGTGCIIAERER